MIELSRSSPSLSTDIYNKHNNEDEGLSTLPDPRDSKISISSADRSPSVTHSDLDKEVTMLSKKLIRAINNQTDLDDVLSSTRHELEAAQERIKHLERENRLHFDLLARGFLVRKSTADSAQTTLVNKLSEERKKRIEIEREKKTMEQELENLSTALFEEANKMVIATREKAERELVSARKKNDKLRVHLEDTESLLRSHQDQLAELKQVMEQMNEKCEDQTNLTSPLSSGFRNSCCKETLENDAEQTRDLSFQGCQTPTYPTSFTHLLQTFLRKDIPSYNEFTSLLRSSKKRAGGSRMSSGSYPGIGISLGLGSHSGLGSSKPNNGSTSSLSTISTSPATPNTPFSISSYSSINGPNSSTPLKDTKFYKRALIEDIEPTLRLDSAPGLSWLARRSFTNAVCEGTLIVEPMPLSSTNKNSNACALCNESRSGPEFSRNHRFRTGGNENSQRYPLCKYCLGRVRSTCDFVGFLRLLKDGHWRCDDEDSERAAWEESVRLRDQMFWSRMGGGVVPIMQYHDHEPTKSPCILEDQIIDQDQQYAKNNGSEISVGEIFLPAEENIQAQEIATPSTLSENNSVEGELLQNDVKEQKINRSDAQKTSPLKITLQDVGGNKGSKPLSIAIPDTFE
ncbi:hypothetical protein K3495_g2649 [Podosphaera aphanis]|nr:hypothetical protein K3495_g2649 [Podosphaera aphanis]